MMTELSVLAELSL